MFPGAVFPGVLLSGGPRAVVRAGAHIEFGDHDAVREAGCEANLSSGRLESNFQVRGARLLETHCEPSRMWGERHDS